MKKLPGIKPTFLPGEHVGEKINNKLAIILANMDYIHDPLSDKEKHEDAHKRAVDAIKEITWMADNLGIMKATVTEKKP